MRFSRSAEFEVQDLGRIEYEEAGRLMLQRVDERATGDAVPDRLLLCEFEPVLTVGRGEDPERYRALGLPVHAVSRGGKFSCADCHDPHQSARQTLGAPTQTCLGCHQEIAGPWVYEHAPVTEDCGYCHAPHGASADFLLEISQPAACISCHTLPVAGAVHEPYAYTTACTDCHNSIHGSYADPHLRR